jgi:hypothetical protein
MPSVAKSVHLTLQLNIGEDYSAEELDRLTRQLLKEIQELEVESVELEKGEQLPEGAKSGELVTLGSLVVVLLPAVAPKVIELLQAWSSRADNRIVKIKAQVEDRSIEVEYSPATMSTDELKRLVTSLSEALPPADKRKPS